MLSAGYYEFAFPMVSIFTRGWGFVDEGLATASPSSAAYEAAQRAVYFPVWVPSVTIARRVWWANGATTTGGATIEAGIYADGGYKPGAKLISGSATQGTASQVQFVDVTDTTLRPGLHWLAILSSSATNTTVLSSTSTAASIDGPFRFQEASLGSLPSSATPAATTGQNLYLFGFSTTTIT